MTSRAHQGSSTIGPPGPAPVRDQVAVGNPGTRPRAVRLRGRNRECRSCAMTADAPPGCAVRAQGRGKGHHHGSRHHAPAPGERRPLRAPDPSLEPQDAPSHLHRAQRHLHRRPDADADLHRQGLRVRQADRRPRRHRAVRRHQEAGPGVDPGAGHPRGHALREPALAGRHAHQPADGLRAREPPQGARADRLRRCGLLRPHQEGAADDAPREGEARAHPRRHPRHVPRPQRGVGRGHQQGAPRRRRGAEAEHPRRRDPGHQLRSRRGHLPDPRQ